MNLPVIFTKILSGVKAAAGTGSLMIRKNADKLMLVGGGATFIVTIVETVKATNKTNEVLAYKEQKEALIEQESAENETYTPAIRAMDEKNLKRTTRIELVKIWSRPATSAIATILLFFVPASFQTAVKYVYVFLMYNIVNAVCLTSIQVPYYSLISLLTRNSYERGFLGNAQQIAQTLGNVFVNAVFTILLTKFSSSTDNYMNQQAFTLTITLLCAIMVVVCFVTVFSTKERVRDNADEAAEGQVEEEKVPAMVAVKSLLSNKYWVMMFFAMLCIFFVIIFYSIGGVYYAIYILGDMGQISWMNNAISIAQFGIMFATPFFMKRFGKRPVYTAGMLLLALGFLGFGLFGTSKTLMIICNVLKGLGLGMAGGMAMGMVADAILYGQLKTGINAVGMGNAGTSAAQKLGLGLGQAIFGWVLSGAGFDAALDAQGIAQPESVITAIQFMYNWIPMIMCAVIFAMMLLFFNLEKDLKKLKAEKGIVE